MQLIQKGNWKKPISISELFEKKGCDEFTLLEEKLTIGSHSYEIWWYSYREKNHILAKQRSYPYTLYFFLGTRRTFSSPIFQNLYGNRRTDKANGRNVYLSTPLRVGLNRQKEENS